MAKEFPLGVLCFITFFHFSLLLLFSLVVGIFHHLRLVSCCLRSLMMIMIIFLLKCTHTMQWMMTTWLQNSYDLVQWLLTSHSVLFTNFMRDSPTEFPKNIHLVAIPHNVASMRIVSIINFIPWICLAFWEFLVRSLNSDL